MNFFKLQKMKFSKLFTLKLFLVLFTLAATPAIAKNLSSTGTTYNVLITQGDSAYNAFDYDRAISCYETAKKQDSTKCSLLLKLSDAYFYGAYVKPEEKQEFFYEKAYRILEKARQLDSTNAGVFARMGQVTGQLALFRGGKEKVKLGLKIKFYADTALYYDPNHPIGNAVMGIWHYQLANLSFFERFFGGIIFGNIPDGSNDTAAVYLKKAVDLWPHMIYYRYAYAKVLWELDKDDEAKKQLQTALSLPLFIEGDRKNKKLVKELLEKI